MPGQNRKGKIQANIFKMVDANGITAGTPENVWGPTNNRRVRLLGWSLSSSANAAIEFVAASADTTVLAQTPLLATAGTHDSPDLGDGILLASNDDLQIDVTGTSTVSGMVWGVEEGAGY